MAERDAGEFIPFGALGGSDLRRGCVYAGGEAPDFGSDPVHHLLPVGVAGGIRVRTADAGVSLMALCSSLEDPEWPDVVDDATGTVVYYGDNRSSTRRADESNGNGALRRLFSGGFSDEKARRRWPPVFVFTAPEAPAPSRSVRFRGLCVPGAPGCPPSDWLVAKWFDGREERFENYVLSLVILDVPVVSRPWIAEVEAGDPLGPSCPAPYREWVEHGRAVVGLDLC